MTNETNLIRITREILAGAFWLYAVLQVFVFDLDCLIASVAAPRFYWILEYKILLFMAAAAGLWLALGHRRFLALFVYVAAYPLIFVFWKLGKPLVRQLAKRWALLLLFAPVMYSAFKRIRSTFALYTLAIICSVLILSQSFRPLTYSTMLGLIVFLFIHFARSLQNAYSPSLFDQLTDGLAKVRQAVEDGAIEKTVAARSTRQSQGATKTKDNDPLTNLYLFHWIADYFNEKIQFYVKRRVVDFYLLASWLYTLGITIIVFALLFRAIYRIDSTSFAGVPDPGFWHFVGFSFERLTPGELSALRPASTFAVLLSYAEGICGILILVILVFVVLTAAREAYRESLLGFTSELRLTATAVERRAQATYNLTLTQLEAAVLRTNQGIVTILRKARGLPELPPPSIDSSAIGKDSPND